MTTLTTVVIAVATMVMARWRRDKWDGNDVWTKERDGNLLLLGDASQRNGGGLPRMGTNDGNGGVMDA